MLQLSLAVSAVGALALSGVQASTVPMLFSAAPAGWNQHSQRACAKALSIRSCSNVTWVKANTPEACCTNTWIDPKNETDPGIQSGLLLVTQFWDSGATNTTAALDSTTIHGLWPDYCNGEYPASCSSTTGIPEYTEERIRAIVSEYDPGLALLMDQFYSSGLPEHEYNKHGTCFSAMRSSCMPPPELRSGYVNGKSISAADYAVLAYFQEIVKQFQSHPTYLWLGAAGIVPSNTTTYALSDVQAALKNATGAVPFIGCDDDAKEELTEFWYYNFVYGPLLGGHYVSTDSTTKSTCKDRVKFLPKWFEAPY